MRLPDSPPGGMWKLVGWRKVLHTACRISIDRGWVFSSTPRQMVISQTGYQNGVMPATNIVMLIPKKMLLNALVLHLGTY